MTELVLAMQEVALARERVVDRERHVRLYTKPSPCRLRRFVLTNIARFCSVAIDKGARARGKIDRTESLAD
jgi:hypothetical protein